MDRERLQQATNEARNTIKAGSALGNITSAVMTGVDTASILIDDFAEQTMRVLFTPALLLNDEYNKEFEEYMNEQSGYRNVLRNNIKNRRHVLENYAMENPKKGLILKPTYYMVEQASDPLLWLSNLKTAKAAMQIGTKAGAMILNGIENAMEYLVEEKSINNKNISDFGTQEYGNLAANLLLGGTIAGATYTNQPTTLFSDKIFDDVYYIQTNPDKAPLDKAVEVSQKVGASVDFKTQGEIVERLESGQTQSLPKNYHNGERVLKTIEEGVMPRINKISSSYKDMDMANEYGRNPKLKNKANRNVDAKASMAQAMKPLYTEIQLGQQQAMGEASEELFNWIGKHKGNDGITPIADAFDEIAENYTPEQFAKIVRGKATDSEKDIELGKILNKKVVESIEIKSQSQIIDKTTGYYLDTTVNKQNFMHTIKEFNENVDVLAKDREEFINVQLKDMGDNVYLNENVAKKYGHDKAGNYNMHQNNNILEEFYLDLNKTTDDYAKAYQEGSVKEEPMTLFEVAIKWANVEGRENYDKIIKKETYEGEELRIKNFYKYGKKKYDEMLKKSDLTKKEKAYKRMYEKNIKKYEELLSKKTLSDEEKLFKENYIKEALDKLEGAFTGYEKKPQEILRDIYSTTIDERSGLNVLRNAFKKFILESESKNIDGYKKTGIKPIDKVVGFTLRIISDKDADTSIREVVQSYEKSLRSINKMQSRQYNELGLADKSIYFIKNTAVYKLLAGLRHLREFSPNTSLVNSGAINLFDTRFKGLYSYVRAGYEMGKLHADLAKNIARITKDGLDSIKDPYERLAAEIFLRRNLENNYAFDKKSFANALSKGAKIAGAGQLVSDINRIVMATRMTAKAMRDEFLNLTFDKMTPLMKSVLSSNGITDDVGLETLKTEIRKFNNQLDFDNYILNTTLENGGKLKSIFEQFVDIMGREFEPFEKDLTQIEAKGFLSKLWLNSTMMFKRYSMGAFSRTWKNLTTFYDSDGILRYKFIKNKNFQWDSFSKSNWGDTFQGFGMRKGINFLEMSALLYASTEATSWLHGKIFGTSQDEIVEAKLEAMKTEPIPIIIDGLKDSMTNYIGYDVMFGGENAPFSIIKQSGNALKRAMSAENLTPIEKIWYSFWYLATPSNVGRGIDNLKFEKGITPRLTTSSTDAQFLWKHYYRKDALLEQKEGELPYMKPVDAIAEKVFSKLTDWYDYYSRNPEKAEDIVGEINSENKEAKIILATGITELAEQSMRSEHINFAFTQDTVEEREEELKRFGLDYQTQLLTMSKDERILFNYVMAFKGIEDPLYLIQALEYVNTSKNKKEAIYSLLEENQKIVFDNFYKDMERNPERRKMIARMGYPDNTEGYMEFLHNLKNYNF